VKFLVKYSFQLQIKQTVKKVNIIKNYEKKLSFTKEHVLN